MRAKLLLFVVTIAAVVGLFVPRQVVVAPEWTLVLKDDSGRPLGRIAVEESWQHYSLEDTGQDETKFTEADGTVRFPMRVVRASAMTRLVGCVRQFAGYAVHASCGPHSSLHIRYPSGFGQNNVQEFSQAELMWGGGATYRSNVVVVHKCKAGGTGPTCS